MLEACILRKNSGERGGKERVRDLGAKTESEFIFYKNKIFPKIFFLKNPAERNRAQARHKREILLFRNQEDSCVLPCTQRGHNL
jgi:hypothetical protein